MSDSLAIPSALAATRMRVSGVAGDINFYCSGSPENASSQTSPPLLLIHSVNAAGSAFEVKPLHEHFAQRGAVYSMDLPGFGFSDRSPREYSPRLMTDAILDMTNEIARRHGSVPINALALSLSSEFLARAAMEAPARFRTLALVSPTGFDRRAPYHDAPGSNRGIAWVYRAFTFPLWSRAIFNALTTRASIRFFLRKTWGSPNIDEALAQYDYATARHPHAHHVVFRFVSGYLFSADITRVYEKLNMPVWMSHGVRGDFTDYRYKSAFSTQPNWQLDVFETGALPFFEQGRAFIERYAQFLEAASKS